MLAFNSLVAAALAVTQYDRTITASSSGQLYLGKGRYVKVNQFSQASTGCPGATLLTELAYAHPYTGKELACTKAQCEPETTIAVGDADGAGQAQCLKKDSQQANSGIVASRDCVSIQSGIVSAWTSGQLPAVTAVQPMFFKAHGVHEMEWFVRYTVTQPAGCVNPSFTINLNARPKNPEDLHCDQALEIGDHFDQPAPSNPSKTVVIPARLEGEDNHYTFDLGTSNALELSCLHVYSTPSVVPTGECQNARIGTDLLLEGPNAAGQAPTVELIETYPCTVHTSLNSDHPELLLQPSLFGGTAELRNRYQSCCKQTTFAACRAHSRSIQMAYPGNSGCLWNHESSTCYPLATAQRKNMVHFVGLSNSTTATFVSGVANPPRSSLIATQYLAEQGYQLQNDRKWHLKVTNPYPATTTSGCTLATTVSYFKTNTGGICEPSTRLMCDEQERLCETARSTVNTDAVELLYWRSRSEPMIPESASHVKEDLSRDHWNTCNCLKQKEVCYRKNGCLTTKRYELILQNCQEAGCGNVCNSGAAAQASLLVLLFAVLALLL